MEETRPKKIVRQFRRYLGTPDAEDHIKKMVSDYEEGSVEHKLLLNFPEFVDSIIKNYDELEDRLDMATRSLEISSKELTESYSRVEKLNINMNTMLDSLSEGLLFFDKTGTCAPIFSKTAENFLLANPSGKNVTHILPMNDDERSSFKKWLSIIFQDDTALDFDDLKQLLPQSFTNAGERYIELDYKPMTLNGELMGVLLILNDMTSQREAERKFKKLQQETFQIKSTVSDSKGFASYISGIKTICAEILQINRKDLNDKSEHYKRILHTYKGMSGMYYLSDIKDQLHLCETILDDIEGNTAYHNFLNAVRDLDILAQKTIKDSESFLGTNFLLGGNSKVISLSQFQNFRNFINQSISNSHDKEAILDYINQEFMATPLEDYLVKFKKELLRLTDQSGKPIPDVKITCDNIKLNPDHYDVLFESFIHIANNIVDHALEHDWERQAMGKDSPAEIKVSAFADNEFLEITVTDDGRGIDSLKIKERMKKLGMSYEGLSHNDIIQTIFLSNFSTQEDISLTSGRGYGMNAVKAAVEDMGGNVYISSDENAGDGTQLHIKIPHFIQD